MQDGTFSLALGLASELENEVNSLRMFYEGDIPAAMTASRDTLIVKGHLYATLADVGELLRNLAA